MPPQESSEATPAEPLAAATGLVPVWLVLVLGGILLLAAVVRLVDITENPRGFFADEASFGLNAFLVLTTGRDEYGQVLPLFFRAFGEFKLPVFFYAEMPVVALIGKTELAVRLTSAVLGCLTVMTTYLLGRELFGGRLPALAAAAFLAILPWHIHYSRTGLGDIITWPLLLTATLYLFLRAIRTGGALWPAAIAFGITFYTYRAAWVALPPLLVILAWLYRRELLGKRRDTLVSAAILALMLVPIGWHLLASEGDRSSQAWIFNLTSDKGTLRVFWDFYTSYFSPAFLFTSADHSAITRHYVPGQGVIYFFQLPLLLIGITWLVANLNRRYALILALLLVYPLSGAVSDSSPISSRTILGSVSIALISAAGLWAMVLVVRRRLPSAGSMIAAITVAIVLVIGTASLDRYLERYFADYPRLSAGYWGWQDGPQDIIQRFLTVQDSYDELYMDGMFNSPGIFFRFYADDLCRKCFIGGADKYNPSKHQLFALRSENPDLQKYDYVVRDMLTYPDGQPSFYLLEFTGKR